MAFDVVRKKEQEWRNAVDAKFRASQDALRSRDCQIKQLKEQLDTLGADFTYNLDLLADRDADLERFESAIERLNAELGRKEEIANCLKIKFDDAQIATRRNFLEYEDRRRVAEKIIAEKDASIVELKRQLETTVEQCTKQLEVERANSQRRLQDLADDAGRRISKFKNQYANALSLKNGELTSSAARSELLVKRAEGRVASLEIELERSKNEVLRLQSSLASAAKEFKENCTSQAKESEARLAASSDTINELAAKLEEERKETSSLRLESDSLKDKLSDAEKKVAERDRILDLMGKRNLPPGDTVSSNAGELQQLKQQNNILRCVIKEMKKKIKSGEEEGNSRVDEIVSVENDVDDQRVSQMENTIGLLKMQMLESLRGKLASRENGTLDPKDPNFGEVRILLLEQKLDRATEDIGKKVALEKKELLAEMKNVRREISSRLTSEHILGNNLVVNRQGLKSDQILEAVRRDILRLKSKIGKMNREHDIEVIERERAERGVGMQASMRHDVVTRHQPVTHRRVDISNPFHLPLPPMQIQGTALPTLSKKVPVQEKKALHTKIRNYNLRD